MASLEREAIVYTANNYDFDGFWVRQDGFNLNWVGNGGTVDDLRYQLFISYYQLTPGEVEIIPEEPVAVYFLEPVQWFFWLGWFVAHGSACLGPGDITAFPEAGYSPCD